MAGLAWELFCEFKKQEKKKFYKVKSPLEIKENHRSTLYIVIHTCMHTSVCISIGTYRLTLQHLFLLLKLRLCVKIWLSTIRSNFLNYSKPCLNPEWISNLKIFSKLHNFASKLMVFWILDYSFSMCFTLEWADVFIFTHVIVPILFYFSLVADVFSQSWEALVTLMLNLLMLLITFWLQG